MLLIGRGLNQEKEVNLRKRILRDIISACSFEFIIYNIIQCNILKTVRSFFVSIEVHFRIEDYEYCKNHILAQKNIGKIV